MNKSEVILEVGGEGGGITLMDSGTLSVGVIPRRCSTTSSTNQRFEKSLRWLIPGKLRFDSSIAIPGTDSTHSQFIRSFVNGV